MISKLVLMWCPVQKCDRSVWMMMVLKLLPFPVAKFLAYTGLAKRLSYFMAYGSRSLAEVVNSLTENKDLRAVLCYIFGTYGKISQLELVIKDACFKTSHFIHSVSRYTAEEILYLVVRCACRKISKRSQFLHAQLADVPLPAWCLVPYRRCGSDRLQHDPHHREGRRSRTRQSTSQPHPAQRRQQGYR